MLFVMTTGPSGSTDVAGVEHIVVEGHHHDFIPVPLLTFVANRVLS